VDFNLSVLFRTEPAAVGSIPSLVEERLMVAADREDSAGAGFGSSSLIVGADGLEAVEDCSPPEVASDFFGTSLIVLFASEAPAATGGAGGATGEGVTDEG
jgi:hypothetical protein